MRFIAFLLFISAFQIGGTAAAAQNEQEEFFEARIRPVLAMSCFKCHGDKKAGNQLRVDSRQSLLKGGKSGPAIVPGEPEKSLLFQAISHSHDEVEMLLCRLPRIQKRSG